MKSSKTNKVKPCSCGSNEFVSKPNRYDIYQVVDNRLELTSSLIAEEEIKLFCRECGEELVDAADLISA